MPVFSRCAKHSSWTPVRKQQAPSQTVFTTMPLPSALPHTLHEEDIEEDRKGGASGLSGVTQRIVGGCRVSKGTMHASSSLTQSDVWL